MVAGAKDLRLALGVAALLFGGRSVPMLVAQSSNPTEGDELGS